MTSRRNFNTGYSRPGIQPIGIFRAEVVEATASSLKVRVPRLGTNGIYSNVPYYGVKPAVGETIIVGLLEGNAGNPVAITPSPYGETAGGGGSSVGGSDTQVQYNNSGVLAGSANMTFDGTSLNVAGLKLASTAITSTAAELNILDGVTSTAAELNILDGVTSTTAELNILDGVTSTTAELNILDGVTSTAAELNLLDGITAGTVSASLAVIADSNKDVTGFRNVTLTGELDAATLDISGDADIDGTTNLDAVDIDGNVQLDGTLSVGVDDTGYDVIFYGATTTNSYFWWDESDDALKLGPDSPLFANGRIQTGQQSFTQEPWSASTIALGNYGSIGTQGSYRTYMSWNYERGTDSAYHHLDINSYPQAGHVAIGNSGIIFGFDADFETTHTTNPVTRVSINSTEMNVTHALRIGTSSSTDPTLKVGSGDALRIENNHGYIDIGSMNDGAEHIYASASTLFLGSSGSARLGITSSSVYPNGNGTIDLGTSGKPWEHFWLAQATEFTSGGYYTLRSRDSDRQVMELTSSERFKKDIVDLPLEEAYKILDARPIKYRGIDDDDSVPLEAGLSAESLHNAGYEYAVRYDEGHWGTTPRSIYYEYLTAPLIAIIKDLKTRLEALES